MIRYRSFKELGELALSYQTYYHEQYQPKYNNHFECPTYGRKRNVENPTNQTSKELWSTPQLYRDGFNQLKVCINPGFGGLFETENDLGYRLRYHFGNEPNPFANTTRPGHIDRMALHGYVIPPGAIRLYLEMNTIGQNYNDGELHDVWVQARHLWMLTSIWACNIRSLLWI